MPPADNAASPPPASTFFDEMRDTEGQVRAAYRNLESWLNDTPKAEFRRRREEAELLFRRLGITFAVYSEDAGNPERLIPFDPIPRVLTAQEWATLERGLVQRVRALNMFLHDIYHDKNIIRAGRIPEHFVLDNDQFRPEMQGLTPMGEIYAHIAGVDVVRVDADEFYVLEDNLRSPSGVSYMVENRSVMMRLFPELFAQNRIAPVDHYPDALLDSLRAVAPPTTSDPTVVVLTPGQFNSAFFEHAFLAEQMGVEVVEGQDLFVADGFVFMRTPRGPQRVDVIYRRIDDDFIDPLAFNPDSMLGVPGLLSVYAQGNVTLANAVGTGVADDKAMYVYVPEMIRFYLSEEPLLKNVPTWQCREPDSLAYVLEHLEELVVKEVAGSGGYGMLVGPRSTKAQREAFRIRLKANAENYVAQPTLALSTCPTFVRQGIAPRHVDLRPYVLSGRDIRVVPGGLTRVALKDGSLVVNSSQGGGTKDTWVLQD